MAELPDSGKLYIEETERKPNRYAAIVLVGVVCVIAIADVFNEVGIFELSKPLMRLCLASSVLMFIILRIIVSRDVWLSDPASKYIIMSMVLLLILTLAVLLNINAILAFVLPLLLATQYRSRSLSALALAGSCIACAAAPILSYLLGTWSLNFLTGYITTFCRVTLSVRPGSGMSAADAIRDITLYWSLPQVLTLCAFGLILFSVTRSGIESVRSQMRVIDLSASLNQQLDSIMSMQEKVLFSMSDILESRDVETGDHVRRTSEIVRLLTDAMRRDPSSGVTGEFCEDVVKAAPMHDLGKIAVPDTVLHKPGRLTEEEFEVVRRHPEKSVEIIDRVLTGIEDERMISTAKNMAKYHHERMDGAGYPEGLKGGEIPLEARIMAIADVYDALVSERCYKAPMGFDEAFATIEASMGSQFDPGLNRYFLSCRESIESFYKS